MKKVLEYLKNKKMKYEIIYHPPAITTEEADKYIEGKKEFVPRLCLWQIKKIKNFI